MTARRKGASEERGSGGLPIWMRFTLSMTVALTVVSSVAGFLLYKSAGQVSANVRQQSMVGATELTAPVMQVTVERQRAIAERELYLALEQQAAKDAATTAKEFPEGGDSHYEGLRRAFQDYQYGQRDAFKAQREAREQRYRELGTVESWKQVGKATEHASGAVLEASVTYADGSSGVIFKHQGREGAPVYLLLPDIANIADRSLLGLVIGITFVIILVGAMVSVWVANQVSRPITRIVEDVRQIAAGDLDHRVVADAGGEVGMLARAIDRMTRSLAEARDNEVELEVRQRELQVAGEVREQLLPQSMPVRAGYEFGHLHLASSGLCGDFLDYIEAGAGGAIGLLVCEVSGKGLPGAIVGATARSYLRSTLAEGGELKAALSSANRVLARDVRRGMAVTSLFASLDAAQGIATVACSGHKVPLIRFTGEDRKVRVVHPEGIALGFDKGPVFESKLELALVPVDKGDRLVLVNSGAVTVVNTDGVELGEKGLYSLVMKHGALPTEQFLAKLRAALLAHAGDAPRERDISIVTVSRA
ncbi:MAG: HAMP domain-containing protein [Planctomycetes bacterium]|nr:HAMP domain-containing protein [Planctomycetota bacterium]